MFPVYGIHVIARYVVINLFIKYNERELGVRWSNRFMELLIAGVLVNEEQC